MKKVHKDLFYFLFPLIGITTHLILFYINGFFTQNRDGFVEGILFSSAISAFPYLILHFGTSPLQNIHLKIIVGVLCIGMAFFDIYAFLETDSQNTRAWGLILLPFVCLLPFSILSTIIINYAKKIQTTESTGK
jgi:hypothetical protein